MDLNAVNEHDILRLKSFLEHSGSMIDPPPVLLDKVATQSAFLGSLDILQLLPEDTHFYGRLARRVIAPLTFFVIYKEL